MEIRKSVYIKCIGHRTGRHWLAIQASRPTLVKDPNNLTAIWIQHSIKEQNIVLFECQNSTHNERWLYARTSGELVLSDENTVRTRRGGKWKIVDHTSISIRIQAQLGISNLKWLDGHTIYGDLCLVSEGEQKTRSGTIWQIVSFNNLSDLLEEQTMVNSNTPVEIGKSIREFREDHPLPNKTAFIMMEFSNTKIHKGILKSTREILKKHDIIGLRADDKQYHNDLRWNVLTYIFGCAFGIAVIERILADTFNPNVAFEIGYMEALYKPICILKEQTVAKLPSDILGKLYRKFDSQNIKKTIQPVLESWLNDMSIVAK